MFLYLMHIILKVCFMHLNTNQRGWKFVLSHNFEILLIKQTSFLRLYHHFTLSGYYQLVSRRRVVQRRRTDLEYPVVVHVLQGEGETLCQHSVHPALHDGRHTEPVQRKLQQETQHVTQTSVILFIVLFPFNYEYRRFWSGFGTWPITFFLRLLTTNSLFKILWVSIKVVG